VGQQGLSEDAERTVLCRDVETFGLEKVRKSHQNHRAKGIGMDKKRERRGGRKNQPGSRKNLSHHGSWERGSGKTATLP